MAKYPMEGLVSITIDCLLWLGESWRGEKDSGLIEEQWSKPEGDTMMGMFRWIKDGKVFFYEFMTIEQTEEGLILRIKHFNQGLIGWEEKEKSFSCVLTQLDGEKAVFFAREEEKPLWLVFERMENSLKIYFDSGVDSPKPENIFQFGRQVNY
jgi:hypothetical protein